MDHLPQISNSNKPILEVPFLWDDRFKYEYTGLREFPLRCQIIIGVSNDGHEDLESSTFFQSWLFFGTLAEVLAPYNISIQPSDFLRSTGHRTLLNTARLREYIAVWVIRASYEGPWCLESDPPSNATYSQEIGTSPHREAKQKAEKIRNILDTVSSILNELVPKRNAVNEKVWDSVLILCSTLRRSASYLYRAYRVDFAAAGSFDSLPSPLLSKCWERGKWCPREKDIVRHLVGGDISVMLLCAQLDRRQGDVSHSRCTESMCYAYQIEDQAYQTRHTTESCDCEFIEIGNKYAQAISKQSRFPDSLQKIPVLTYSKGSIQIVSVSPYVALTSRVISGKIGNGSSFVAISHVWAHGRGNPRLNALPRCQVEVLQVSLSPRFSSNGQD